ncbi:MAG: CoB--CoM heterodisulfide reductase iron-sulfur subunit B family protein [Anaerolineae bacterium]|nr:CoB--CoM heterodisulfide reductase iron-sulfur subunit B family protein [Anaerolineae bacterium]
MSQKTYTYYPGCSLQHGNHAYEVSNRAVAKALGFELAEIDDWNCCGATEYFSLNRLPAYALVARNLARAADGGATEVVAPCSACFLNLYKTDKHMKLYPKLNDQVNEALGAGNLSYKPGTLKVRHLLEMIITDVGFDMLKDRTRRPLYGLNFAPYYGCLIARPDNVLDSTEQPTLMDQMIEVLGAKATDFHLKTFCCGGHMTQISEETAYGMIHRIIKNAVDSGADAIVTICPMCQMNLDVYQGYANDMFGTKYEIPVMFFTQVIGLALGLSPRELGFGQEFVNMSGLIDKIQSSPPPKAKAARRPKEALPMPVMPE